MSEPLVMLPGMMCDARLYEHQLLHLARDRAVTIAPISHGERIEEIASHLLEQLPQRFALAGLSMGGIVAMEMIRRAPDRISRLCLMATDALADTPQIAAAREPLIVSARAGQLDAALAQVVNADTLAPGPGRMAVLETLQHMGQELGADLFVQQMRALQRRPDQQGTLRKIKVPTLILCGAYDMLTPVKRHNFMAELVAGARLRVIEEAGHVPTLEAPAAVTDILRSWLDEAG